MMFFKQNCDKEALGQERRFSTHSCGILFLIKVAKNNYSYYITFVWLCNVALWYMKDLCSYQTIRS